MTGSALIIEDHPLYRDALMHMLSAVFDNARTHAVRSAEEGLRLAPTLPDLRVIVLDLGLPGLSGAEAIRSLVQACPKAAIIVVSASEDRREAEAAMRAGARAFISKATPTEVMTDAVRRLLAGEMPVPEWITPSSASAIGDFPLPTLTPRQVDTLVLLCQGHSNKEIGLRLGLVEITVKMHVSSIFRALGIVNRTQAVLAARRLGLYTPTQGN